MLDGVFSNMCRPAGQLDGDQQSVDIKHIVYAFRGTFDPFIPNDAYKFLIHMMNGITKETVSPKSIFKEKDRKKYSVLKYLKSGVLNQQFGLLSGGAFKCRQGHKESCFSS